MAVGVPVIRHVEPFTATARPVGNAGETLHDVVAPPVLVKDSGEIATVSVYV